jgi:hypothetical protein
MGGVEVILKSEGRSSASEIWLQKNEREKLSDDHYLNGVPIGGRYSF